MATFKAEFSKADSDRQSILKRMRECAAFTIPTILPGEHITQTDDLLYSYQSLGADGVANLVNKLLVALFSPTVPWFRYAISQSALLEWQNTPELLVALEAALYAREHQIKAQLETTKYRPKMHRSGRPPMRYAASSPCDRARQRVERRKSHMKQIIWILPRHTVSAPPRVPFLCTS